MQASSKPTRLTLANTSFHGNLAASGGGVSCSGSIRTGRMVSLEVTDHVQFVANRATARGGGIAVHERVSSYLRNAVFRLNVAELGGGALAVKV